MTELHLMQATLDMRNMGRWAAEEKHSDPDRTAHCLMTESFGPETAPKPFVIKTQVKNGNPTGKILAYTSLTAAELAETAQQRQKLAHAAVLNPDTIRAVPIPTQWSEGRKLGFEIRVRPTKRRSDRGQSAQELDYFLGAPPGSDREDVYCRWLAEALKRQGALLPNLEDMHVTQLAMRRVRRQRSSQWHTGPDVTIDGTAIVVNPDCMMSVLAGGIGRHKGYGYGMLLLRPGGHPFNG